MLCDTGVIIHAFRNLTTPTFFRNIRVVANNFNENPKFGYLIGRVDQPLNAPLAITDQLTFNRIINPGSDAPILTDPINITVPLSADTDTFNAPHLGNLDLAQGKIDTFDSILFGTTHVRKNILYSVQHVRVNHLGTSDSNQGPLDRVGIRWYEIDVTGGHKKERADTVPTVKQVGSIYDPRITENPEFFYWPAIMTNENGDISISSSSSANDKFINAVYFTSKKNAAINPITGLKEADGPFYLTKSSTPYNFQFATTRRRSQRWGDYTRAVPDPVDKKSSWHIQQFCSDTDVWAIQASQIKP